MVGLFEQESEVRLVKLEDLWPQHLHVYCDFSVPSYNACFFPSGFFEHESAVSELTLDDL
ncbi:hypothetical protein BA768_18390 [Chryseobacterium sp. CBo1]|nr:hypothetical protein BA768_18390 [Chryseobacterium sp. CBo1]